MVKRIPLDNVCAKKIPTLSSQYDGLIDYVDISSVDNVEKRIVSMQCVSAKEAPSRAKQLLEVGDILVSTVRPNLNAVAMVEQQTDDLLVGSTGYCVLRCNDSIDKRYVFHFCQSPYFIDDMTSQATGASYPAVSSGIVKSSTIPNHPMETQKQIADRLDKVSELISLRKEQLAKLDQLIKSRFIELFGDCGHSINKVLLEEISEFVTVGIANSATHAYADSGIVLLRNQNIKENYLDENDLIYITPDFAKKYGSKQLTENDILVIRTGYPGVACLVPKKYEGCQTFTTLIVRLKNTAQAHANYVCHYINSSFGKDYVEQSKVGVAQQNFGAKALAKMPIVVPPMELQEQFAAVVEQTNKSKLAIQQSLDKLELLKNSLMQDYFG